MKPVILTLCLSLMIACRIFSQADTINFYTLQQCVDIALKNNIQLKQNALNIETSDVSLRLAREAIFPTLNANANQGLSLGRSINPVTNTFADQQILSNNFQINSNVVLFNSFRLKELIRQNSFNREAAKFDYRDYQYTVTLNVINAYIQVLFNKELLKTAQNLVKVSDSQLKRTERLVKAGTLPEANAYDINAQKASNELSAVNAENQLNISKLNLIQLMNLPLIDNTLNTFDIESPVISIDSSKTQDNAHDIYKIAESTQPIVKSSELRIRGSEAGIRAANANKYPRLTLNGTIFTNYSSASNRVLGYTLGNPSIIGFLTSDPTQTISQPSFTPIFEKTPFSNQLRSNLSQVYTLNLSIPIYGNYVARGAVQNAMITRKNAILTLENNKMQLRTKIEQAYINAISARKKMEAAEIQLMSYEEAFRITEKRFNAGVINSVDYNVASNNLLKSQSDLLQAKYDLFLRIKIIEFYKGEAIDN